MPSYKSFWSSLAYHTVTRPSIDAVRHITKNLKSNYKNRRLRKKGFNPDIVKKVQGVTRGPLAASGRLWSRKTLAGQKRRDEAARRARGLSRPTRSKTGDIKAIKPVKTKGETWKPKPSLASIQHVRSAVPGGVVSAVNTSPTMGRLRRKLTINAVRKTTRGMITPALNAKGEFDRTKHGQNIRALRKSMGPKFLRDRVKQEKAKNIHHASVILQRRKLSS